MRRVILTRLASLVVVLLALSAAIFTLQAVVPADPARAYVGASASAEAVARAREDLGYDEPLVAQYRSFLGRLVDGDLGTSLRTRRPVTEDLGDFLPATLELAAVALGLAVVLGLAMGVTSAARTRGSGPARVGLFVLAGSPVFLLGLLGILLFYARLGWLPGSGRTSSGRPDLGPTGFLLVDALLHGDLALWWDAVRHLALPAAVLSVGPAVAIGRTLRSSLESGMRQDWFRTARAKGLTDRRALVVHGLRNAAGPALAMTGLQFGALLAGVVVVETVFAWPGLGYYVSLSIPRADFPAIAGVTLALGVAFVVINAVVDILQAVADPRVDRI